MEHSIYIDQISSDIFKEVVIDWFISAIGTPIDQLIETNHFIKNKYSPNIVTAYLESDDIKKIKCLSELGYTFIQCRFSIEKSVDFSRVNLYPFKLVKLTTRKQFDKLLNLAEKMEFDDRFSIDPEINKNLTLKRNMYFLEKSFENQNEVIFMLLNVIRNSILGFRSFKIDENRIAHLLLTGTINKRNSFELNQQLGLLEIEEFLENDVRKIMAVLSVNNIDELNLYLSNFKYRVLNSTIVLRKIY